MPKQHKQRIRIVVADDHLIFLDSLCDMLSREPHLEIAGRAPNGDALFKLVIKTKPDLLITDISMPGRDVLTILPDLLQKFPKLWIIVLSMYSDTSLIVDLLNIGVQGYLLKQAGRAELLKAIRLVSEGGTYFTKTVSDKLIRLSQRTGFYPFKNKELPQFSEREIVVIKMIYSQMSSKEMADELHLNKHTVDSIRERIQHRIGARNVVGIVIFALQNGYVSLD